MTKQIPLVVAATALSAGCAALATHSPEGWRRTQPRLVEYSTGSPTAVLGCVERIWQNQGQLFTRSQSETSGSLAIGRSYLVDVSYSASGGTEIRAWGGAISNISKMDELVRSCTKPSSKAAE